MSVTISDVNPVRELARGRTYRRIVHVLLGAVLLLPYLALTWVFVGVARAGTSPAAIVAPAALAVVVGGLVAVVPGVRALEVTAARALLGVALPDPDPGSERDWPARRRGAAWLLAGMLVGGVAALAILVAVPTALGLLLAPWLPAPPLPTGAAAWWAVPLGLVLLVALLAVLATAGAGLARLAPSLLGPTPSERLAAERERLAAELAVERERLAAERERAARLAERARLARELHDSVGHALTVSTVQAGAAAEVLDTDPAFARRALAAIAETGRAALEDLDHVLGLLREDLLDGTGDPPSAPVRDLGGLDALVSGARSAGVPVELVRDGDPAALSALPAAVSREGYRLVQEALTNALRHAGPVPVAVRLAARGAGVEIVVENPLPDCGGPDCGGPDCGGPDGGGPDGGGPGDGGRHGGGPGCPGRDGGGRGLRGMAERAALLGGELTAGPVDEVWRLAARLPGAAR